MNKKEFLILDNLYFVTHFNELLESCMMEPSELKENLWKLIEKDWVNCLSDPENEVSITPNQYEENYSKYYYLASKQGLLEHNLR